MIRVKNRSKAERLKAELEALQDYTLDCFSMDDADLGGPLEADNNPDDDIPEHCDGLEA